MFVLYISYKTRTKFCFNFFLFMKVIQNSKRDIYMVIYNSKQKKKRLEGQKQSGNVTSGLVHVFFEDRSISNYFQNGGNNNSSVFH